MKKVNTHGLNMRGLRQACSKTENYPTNGLYNEIFYNIATGSVWTVLQYSLGRNSWTKYDDPDVIWVCDTSHHMTMQQIADAINEAYQDYRYTETADAL